VSDAASGALTGRASSTGVAESLTCRDGWDRQAQRLLAGSNPSGVLQSVDTLTARRQILSRTLIGSEESPRSRILAVTTDLFYREGIRAVGIDRLIREAGVAKATFYAHFPSKNDLILTYLSAWSDAWCTWFFEAVDEASPSAAGRLQSVLDVLETLFDDPDYRGDAFAKALSEMSPTMPGLRQICLDHKDRIVDFLGRLADGAGVARPDEFARELLMVIDGAMAMAAREGTPAAAGVGRRVVQALLVDHRS